MKILIEEDKPIPLQRSNEEMDKLASAFDALKVDDNKSLFIPIASVEGKWKKIEGAVTAIRAGITKRKIRKADRPVVKAYDDGIRVWKKHVVE